MLLLQQEGPNTSKLLILMTISQVMGAQNRHMHVNLEGQVLPWSRDLIWSLWVLEMIFLIAWLLLVNLDLVVMWGVNCYDTMLFSFQIFKKGPRAVIWSEIWHLEPFFYGYLLKKSWNEWHHLGQIIMTRCFSVFRYSTKGQEQSTQPEWRLTSPMR